MKKVIIYFIDATGQFVKSHTDVIKPMIELPKAEMISELRNHLSRTRSIPGKNLIAYKLPTF